MNTINKVVKKELCTGCGTCTGICPYGAIRMVKDEKRGIYFPKIDEKKCRHCGLCLKACPGASVNFKQLNLSIFGKEPENKLIGNYLQCYTGYSTNERLRHDCSSGGIVTQLLIYLLEKNIIDGALVTKMKKDNPLEPEPFIAKTKKEIISGRGSKYCPVPVNVGLKGILSSKKNEKIAVVGLPCHIQGIRKAEEVLPELKKRIILHIGLFCNHTPNFSATKVLLEKFKIRPEKILKLDYRGEGWPGKMKIRTKNKDFLISDYWSIIGSPKFTAKRCKLCTDATAELADISCGDAWLPEFLKDRTGTSIIIIRSPISRQILEFMKRENRLNFKKTVTYKVILSQRGVLDYKKIEVPIRIRIRKLFSKNNPFYNIKFLNPNLRDISRILKSKMLSHARKFLVRINLTHRNFP